MHRDLIVIFGLHHDELDLMIFDELYITLESVPHLDLTLNRD